MVKLLICGDLFNDLQVLRNRVTKLHSSNAGPFDIVLCTGISINILQSLQESTTISASHTIASSTNPGTIINDTTSSGSTETKFPIPVYFLTIPMTNDSSSSNNNNENIIKYYASNAPGAQTHNLIHLGHTGITTLCGLRIVYYDGTETGVLLPSTTGTTTSTDSSTSSSSSVSTIPTLLADLARYWVNNTTVDILLTRNWPHGILNGVDNTNISSSSSSSSSSSTLSVVATTPSLLPAATVTMYATTATITSASQTAGRIAQAAAPRYHFTGSSFSSDSNQGIFYQRPPFISPLQHVNRYIALANVPSITNTTEEGKGERKYLHALNLQPSDTLSKEALKEIPTGTTVSPYTVQSNPRYRGGDSHQQSYPAQDNHSHHDTHDQGINKRMRIDNASLQNNPVNGNLSAETIARLEAESSNPKNNQFFWNLPQQRQPQQNQLRNQRGNYDRNGIGSQLPPLGSISSAGLLGAPPSFSNASSQQDTTQHRSHNRNNFQRNQSSNNNNPPTECWFCLASPQVEKHLVVSIGAETYLALPKGGVSDTHVLILPISHFDSFASATPSVQEEVQTFLDALSLMYSKRGLSLIAFERVLHRIGQAPLHTHIQVIGVPFAMAKQAKDMFMNEGKFRLVPFDIIPDDQSLSLTVKLPSSSEVTTTGSMNTATVVTTTTLSSSSSSANGSTIEYLFVEVPDSTTTTGSHDNNNPSSSITFPLPPRPSGIRLLHKIPTGIKHPLQFGREILCRLLNVPEKLEWRKCAVDKEKETELTNNFRKEFAPYDFTLAVSE